MIMLTRLGSQWRPLHLHHDDEADLKSVSVSRQDVHSRELTVCRRTSRRYHCTASHDIIWTLLPLVNYVLSHLEYLG